jgi:hypothetical protein
MTLERWQERIWWIAFWAIGIVMVAHFSLVQLYNMPLSPLKLSLTNQLNEYINPFFSQRWSFFAPTPIDRSYSLVARAQYADGNADHSRTTDWFDVSDPLIDAIRKNRLTPFFDVEIGVSNALISLANALPSDPDSTYQKDGRTYIKPQIPAATDPLDMMILRRTALAMLETANPGKTFQQIQLGVVVGVFPRFTERHDPNARTRWSFFSVGWQQARWVTPYSSAGFRHNLPSDKGR